LLVEGEERLFQPWDFFHCPAGTEHVFVGAGDGPSVILMVGARSDDEQLLYPVSELAARYGASVVEATSDPEQAYAGWEEPQLARPSYWDLLPWASWTFRPIVLSEKNVEHWTRANAEFTDAEARGAWAEDEFSWGKWAIPDAELGIMGDVSGLDAGASSSSAAGRWSSSAQARTG
jgi:hypothetical protein